MYASKNNATKKKKKACWNDFNAILIFLRLNLPKLPLSLQEEKTFLFWSINEIPLIFEKM